MTEHIELFEDSPVSFIEQLTVAEGVVCDVYSFNDDQARDLGIVSVSAGLKTPLQKVLKGDKTIEGYISGSGTLLVNNKQYKFPDCEQTRVEVKVGDTMQWHAETDLVFSEVCHPPYVDGRYENIG